MQSKREHEKQGREKLARIISTCKAVEERSLDPFLVDVDESIRTAREYLPEWKIPEDLCLDAETIHSIASVVKLQSEWVKHRSTSLYTDPFLLKHKIMRLDKHRLVATFAQVWRPIVEFEQISIHSIMESLQYWINLLPLDERWKEQPPQEVQAGHASREELVKERILRERMFSEELAGYWQQLKARVAENGQDGKVSYWGFVGADTYEETVDRAFMTAFLITYGYATLEIHPLEEEMFIKPNEKPETKIANKQLVSVPIPIPVEDWQKWKRGELK
jgi:hypothetical protein